MINSSIKQNSNSELLLHCITLFLVYAYVRQQLTFSIIWAFFPSILAICGRIYSELSSNRAIYRARCIASYTILFLVVFSLGIALKGEGGFKGGLQDHKELVRHRGILWLIGLFLIVRFFYSMLSQKVNFMPPLLKKLLLSIFSSLSMPLTICSGGACNSIYVSTITSILSAFSVPVTMIVPFLNYAAYGMQLFGLASLYSADKWRSTAFWIYVAGMTFQIILPGWLCCSIMIIAVLINAKTSKFVYGRKIFKNDLT